MEAVRADWILLSLKYKVTDAGITSGETIFGALDRVTIKGGGNDFLVFESNEVADVAVLLNGYAPGTYADPTPTTATYAYAFILLRGPWPLAGLEDPEIYLEMGAITDEWGGASAFELEASALMLKSDVQAAPGYFYERVFKPTNVRHEFQTIGPGFVEDAFFVVSDVTYVDRIEVDYGMGSSPLAYTRPYELNQLQQDRGRAANTTGLLLENVDMPNNSRRQFVLKLNTTSTATGFFRNILSA